MIKSLRLGNFKAFADTQHIPIRPLTLIFGANSAGKSTILHSLLYLRHTLDTGELDAQRLTIGGESVDLGGFRQFVHKRSVGARVELSLSLDASLLGRLLDDLRTKTWGGIGESSDWQRMLSKLKTVGISLFIGVKVDDLGEPIPGEPPKVTASEITMDTETLFRFALRPDGFLQMTSFGTESAFAGEFVRAVAESVTSRIKIESREQSELKKTIDELVPRLVISGAQLIPDGLANLTPEQRAPIGIAFISKTDQVEQMRRTLSDAFPRTIDELLRGIHHAIAQGLSNLNYLGPLRSYPPRHLAFTQAQDPNWYAGGGYAWNVVRTNTAIREIVNKWLSDEKKLNTPYKLQIQKLYDFEQLDRLYAGILGSYDETQRREFLKQFDELLSSTRLSKEEQSNLIQLLYQRFEVETGKPAEDIELDVHLDRVHQELFPEEYVTEEPEDLIGSSSVIQEYFRGLARTMSEKIEFIPELVLVDQRSNTIMSHRDVGIGISQVLPVLVHCYANEKKVIAIEQPEIHLHPALQAELGDVFIESALGDRKNTFLLETHSEHLILRIMRRIRETMNGNLPEGIPPIRSEDVSILYVEPDGSRSIVREMELNANGELVKAWPGGFFEEGLREVFA